VSLRLPGSRDKCPECTGNDSVLRSLLRGSRARLAWPGPAPKLLLSVEDAARLAREIATLLVVCGKAEV